VRASELSRLVAACAHFCLGAQTCACGSNAHGMPSPARLWDSAVRISDGSARGCESMTEPRTACSTAVAAAHVLLPFSSEEVAVHCLLGASATTRL